RHHGALFIADEVATGFGRTGRMFACEHAGITPDLMCLGKGISGGYLPLAATLTTEEVFEAFLAPYEEFRAFFHGHTYTGNALAGAVGLASLRLFEEERTLERLAPKIARLREHLAADVAPLPHVGDVRQQGAMVGIELVQERASRAPYPPAARIGQRVVRAARARGVILRPLGSTIVLMPPLAIAPAELEQLVDVTRDALVEAAGGLLVPLRGTTTWVDLAARVSLPVLIVGANRLGTINHCALTARVAAAAGLTVRGFVLTEPTATRDESATTNAEMIAALTGLRCLAVLRHGEAADSARLSRVVEAALGLGV